MGKHTRRVILGLALLVGAGCWAFTFGGLMLYGFPGKTQWTAEVLISTLTTEGTLWVGAFTIGWTIVEQRRRLWQRLTRGWRW